MIDKFQIVKIRRCVDGLPCQFKNTWWDDKQCLAKFHVWHTCRLRGKEERLKKPIENESE